MAVRKTSGAVTEPRHTAISGAPGLGWISVPGSGGGGLKRSVFDPTGLALGLPRGQLLAEVLINVRGADMHGGQPGKNPLFVPRRTG